MMGCIDLFPHSMSDAQIVQKMARFAEWYFRHGRENAGRGALEAAEQEYACALRRRTIIGASQRRAKAAIDAAWAEYHGAKKSAEEEGEHE